MRIAYICADRGVPPFGRKGCSIHIQEVLRAMRKAGGTVELFVASRGNFTPSDLDSIPVHVLPCYRGDSYTKREIIAIRTNKILKKLLRENGPFDMIYERYSLWSFAAMAFARDMNIPGILEVNAPLIEEQATHRTLIHQEMAVKVADKVFNTASALVAVSKEVARYLEGYVQKKHRIKVITNGVDLDRFTITSPSTKDTTSGIFTVGFIGTLKPWHGVSRLIRAFNVFQQQYKSSQLLIVGDGPEKERLANLVVILGLDKHVRFTGAVDHNQIPQLLHTMNVAVAPYPKLSGFYFSPLKIFEYMAAGLPVVASRIGQLNDLIEHEETGLLCSPDDEEALAEALVRLWKNPSLKQRLGKTARSFIVHNHSWKSKVKQILDVAASYSACRGEA